MQHHSVQTDMLFWRQTYGITVKGKLWVGAGAVGCEGYTWVMHVLGSIPKVQWSVVAENLSKAGRESHGKYYFKSCKPVKRTEFCSVHVLSVVCTTSKTSCMFTVCVIITYLRSPRIQFEAVFDNLLNHTHFDHWSPSGLDTRSTPLSPLYAENRRSTSSSWPYRSATFTKCSPQNRDTRVQVVKDRE